MTISGLEIDWPFWTVPDEYRANNWAGRPELKTQIDGLLRSWQRKSQSEITIYWAEWGQGKTHTLYHIKNKANDVNNTNIVHYVQLPPLTTSGSPFKALYDQIMLAFPIDILSKRVYEEFKSNPMQMFNLGPSNRRQSAVLQLLWLARNPNLLGDIAERWLRGERITQAQIKMLEIGGQPIQVPPVPKSAQDCQNILSTIIDIIINFPSRNYGEFVLLIDEFQRIGSLGNRKMKEVCDALHLIYNGSPNGLKLVLAFATGDPNGIVDSITGDLMSRISHKVGLPNPDITSVVLYVEELLKLYTNNPDKHGPFYPFDPPAAKMLCDYTYEVSQGYCTLRKINLVFNRCFEWVLDQREIGTNATLEGSIITEKELSKAVETLDEEIRSLIRADSE